MINITGTSIITLFSFYPFTSTPTFIHPQPYMYTYSYSTHTHRSPPHTRFRFFDFCICSVLTVGLTPQSGVWNCLTRDNPQSHVKEPGHSAISASGRLQLNTHAPYVCGFAWSDMVHSCMVYKERAETAAVSCGTSHASAARTYTHTTSAGIQKRVVKS